MKIVKALYSNQDLSGTFYFDSWTEQNLWTFLWEKYFPFSIWRKKWNVWNGLLKWLNYETVIKNLWNDDTTLEFESNTEKLG